MDDLSHLSGKDFMEQAYPAQWYGIVSIDPITKNKFVTTVLDTKDPKLSVFDIPASACMVALTQVQYISATSAACKIPLTEDNKIIFPNRYIATYDETSVTKRVTGWLDLWTGKSYAIRGQFISVHPHDWHTPGYRTDSTKVVRDGAIISTGTITSDLSPSSTAQHLLEMFETEMLRKFATRNKAVPQAAVDYIEALEDVIAGKLAELPVRPDL